MVITLQGSSPPLVIFVIISLRQVVLGVIASVGHFSGYHLPSDVSVIISLHQLSLVSSPLLTHFCGYRPSSLFFGFFFVLVITAISHFC